MNLYKKITKQIAERNFKAPIVAKVDFILELFWRLIWMKKKILQKEFGWMRDWDKKSFLVKTWTSNIIQFSLAIKNYFSALTYFGLIQKYWSLRRNTKTLAVSSFQFEIKQRHRKHLNPKMDKYQHSLSWLDHEQSLNWSEKSSLKERHHPRLEADIGSKGPGNPHHRFAGGWLAKVAHTRSNIQLTKLVSRIRTSKTRWDRRSSKFWILTGPETRLN